MSADLPLFVYGSLASGGQRAGLLGAHRRGRGWIAGTLWHLPAGYPAATLEGSGQVHGEWVEAVPARMLALLDRQQGVHEGLSRRLPVRVHTATSAFDAWAWVMDDPAALGGRVVPSGRWRASNRR